MGEPDIGVFRRTPSYIATISALLIAGSAQAASMWEGAADYRFQNVRSSSVGNAPALTKIGPGANTTTDAVVDGTQRRVLSFPEDNGLRLSPTKGVISNGGYTIVVLFELDAVSGFRRILDFKNGASDNGLYVQNGALRFFPHPPNSFPAPIAANTYVQVALTRNGGSKEVAGYVNGVQQFTFTDTANDGKISAANVLRFFRDNGAEHSAGSVARIRLFKRPLTGGEIALLDRSDFIVNSTRATPDANEGDGTCATFDGIANGDVECTLRAAVLEANATEGVQTISFGIPTKFNGQPTFNCNQTTKVCTILPTTLLIEDTVIIDGYTQGESTPQNAADDARENTRANGTNAGLKIELSGAGSGLLDAIIITDTSDSVVRGLVINRWAGYGVGIVESHRNTIEGNFIGTDVTGTLSRGNGDGGVVVIDGDDNVIGGNTAAARNLISANGAQGGIWMADPNFDNLVQGNLIGTKANGVGELGNLGPGVRLDTGFSAQIGGSRSARNVIAFNGDSGVIVGSGAGNDILMNSIFGNDGLGIDLQDDGVTPNDARDPDTGANGIQNYPRLTSAISSATTTTIEGRLNSTPDEDYTIQFFSMPAVDISGFGEGNVYLGQKQVHTDALGNVDFTFSPGDRVPPGRAVTATATRAGGTSEFSRARAVTSP